MKKTTKTQALRFVRNVVRDLSPSDLKAVNGGNVIRCGGNTGCLDDTKIPPVACEATA
jgi:hypothetical protein